MSKWHSMPAAWPVDGVTVWVRLYWPGVPFLGTWTAATGLFSVSGGLTLPWWAVQKWREV